MRQHSGPSDVASAAAQDFLSDVVRPLIPIGNEYCRLRMRWASSIPASVIAAYRESIDRLSARHGFQSVDVVGLGPDHPQKAELRAKFLNEHTHDEFEVRFFVEGRGIFYLHANDRVYIVLCEQGDLLSVPAGTRHWFDMGTHPSFRCIRLFTTPDGWIASFTGDPIAQRFPDFDQFLARHA